MKKSDKHKRNEFITVHVPCPCGMSSDAFCVRSDGSGFCFSCNENYTVSDLEKEIDLEPEGEISYDYFPHRGISKKTFQFYKVQTKFLNKEPFEVGFPFGENAAKVRRIDDKTKQKCIGEFKSAGLFGKENFDPGSKESITIFEGEYDSMAGLEMTRGESACVSLKSGWGSAYRDLVADYDYVNSFSKIYVCFDNDDRGRDALKAVQGLFDFQKVYVVKRHKFKDANEYLQNRACEEFYRAWTASRRFAPDNIISTFSDIENALEQSTEDQLGTYPFPELNEKLYGLHAGEVIVVKAPEGVGKTEFFRSLEHHLLKTTDHPI